jgi:hypothetical protein
MLTISPSSVLKAGVKASDEGVKMAEEEEEALDDKTLTVPENAMYGGGT